MFSLTDCDTNGHSDMNTHTHKKALQSITKVVYFKETESFGLLAGMLYDIYYIHLLICEISYIQNFFSNFSNKV